MLAGIYRADAGHIEVDGVAHQFHSPAQAIAAGIGMVHQHFRLVAPMTVAENIHLGWDATPARITRRRLVARTNALMDQFGLPRRSGGQDLAALGRRAATGRDPADAGQGDADLILDEPTAVLTTAEARDLFGVVRSLVSTGRTVVFISHKLNEVLEVGDRITVLRNGERVVTRDAVGVTARELASLMTGEERELAVVHRDTSANEAVMELRSRVGTKLAWLARAAGGQPDRAPR